MRTWKRNKQKQPRDNPITTILVVGMLLFSPERASFSDSRFPNLHSFSPEVQLSELPPEYVHFAFSQSFWQVDFGVGCVYAEFAGEAEYVEEGQVVAPSGHVLLPVILVSAYVLVQVAPCTCVCTVAVQPSGLVITVDVEPSPEVATPEEPTVAAEHVQPLTLPGVNVLVLPETEYM